MDYNILLYFLVGVLQDFLMTLNLRFIAKERIILAAVSSFFTTIVSLLIIYNILTQLDKQRSIIAIIVYALGIGIGTFFAMKLKIVSQK
jgi:uncharacterized protein YebE (UPF0316 family)